MRGNPTAGIILLLGSALLIGFGGKYQDRLKGAFASLKGSPATTTTTTKSNTTNSPKTIQNVIDNGKKTNTTTTPTTSWGGVSL